MHPGDRARVAPTTNGEWRSHSQPPIRAAAIARERRQRSAIARRAGWPASERLRSPRERGAAPARSGAARGSAQVRIGERAAASERSISRRSSTSPAQPLPASPATESARPPSVCTSGSSSTPKRSSTRSRPARPSPRARPRSSPSPVFSMKFACLGAKRAPPTARPLQPASASSSPALRPSARGSSGFLNVEPNVLIPCGWASWRRARMLRERRLDRVRVRLGEQQRRARHDLPGREVRAAGRRTRAARGRGARTAAGRRDLDPLERPRQLAAVGVRVHPHRAADGARGCSRRTRSPTAPRCAARAATAGSRAPPPQTHPPARRRSITASSRSSFNTSPRTPSSAISRFEPEPTTATASARRAPPTRAARAAPPRCPRARRTRPRRRCAPSSGARAESRAARPAGGRRRPGRAVLALSRSPRTSLRASASTSPGAHHHAHIALAEQRAQHRLGVGERRQPIHRPARAPRRPPPRRSAGRSRPGWSSARSRAG